MLCELFPVCLRSFSPLLGSGSGKNYLSDSFLIPLIVCTKRKHQRTLLAFKGLRSIIDVASMEVGIEVC